MENNSVVKYIDKGIDLNPIYNAMQQISVEIHDALQISDDDAAKIDHVEYGIRVIPELFVNVYPRR